jgi:hypothetical protein
LVLYELEMVQLQGQGPKQQQEQQQQQQPEDARVDERGMQQQQHVEQQRQQLSVWAKKWVRELGCGADKVRELLEAMEEGRAPSIEVSTSEKRTRSA